MEKTKAVAILQGELIGYSGISGNASASDPHLHLEFHDLPQLTKGKHGKVNPSTFFGAPPIVAKPMPKPKPHAHK